jgi:SAM-dependent methyltransferase
LFVFSISTFIFYTPSSRGFNKFTVYNYFMDHTGGVYQKAFDLYGESPKSLHWVDYPSQARRFKPLVADLDLEGKSILDAGCGLGDLLPYLYAKADSFQYFGMDINEDFIEVAKKRYGGHKFKVGDPFSKRLLHGLDVVISSGTMNQNVPNWLEARKKMIRGLWGNTREALAFNMAGSFKPWPHDSLIAYADSQVILEYCLTLTDKVNLKADYLPQDFTVIMYK